MKRISLIFLLMAMWLAVFCAGAAAQDFDVGTADDLNNAITQINNTSNTDTTFKITLTGDITISGFGISRPGVTVTLLGKDHSTLKLGQGSIRVAGSKSKPTVLNLGSPDSRGTLTISGEYRENDDDFYYYRNDNPGALYIQKYGVCNMYQGVTIENVINNNYFGGGASVEGGTFNMYGGTISKCGVDGGSVCYGGGVAVYANGTFNMSGGTISECFAKTKYIGFNNNLLYPSGTGGGVYVGYRSTFNMSDGIITGCEASTHGGGVMVQGSYWSYEDNNNYSGFLDSRFSMSGGVIKNCKAVHRGGGIAVFGTYDNAYQFAWYTYKPSEPNDPGVYISRGEIHSNTASEGGGVYAVFLKRNISIENTRIYNNTAKTDGGGIYVFSDFTNLKVDRCTITGNHAGGKGGGLQINDNKQNGYTTVKNSVLCNNTAEQCASDVYVYNSPVNLPSAIGMKTKYTGKPDVMIGKEIDGWYADETDSRYVDGERTPFSDAPNFTLDGQEYCLIAAPGWNPPKYTLRYGDGRSHDGEWGYNYKEPDDEGYYDPDAPKALPTEVRYFSEKDAENPLYPGVEGEGYYFLAWSRTDSAGAQHIEVMTPASNCGDIEYSAHWLRIKIDIEADISTDVTIESGQSLVEVDERQKDALAKNINPEEDIRGNNCKIEIIMTVTDKQLPADELACANAALAKALGTIPSNHRLDYDLSVLKRITVDGEEVERKQLKKLAAPIEITFAVPIEWQTGGKVHVFRTHTTKDDRTSTVELDVLHASAQSCTVSTDEFSVYTLVFVPDQSSADALPKTGDPSSIPLLLGVALLACIGLALLRKPA